MSGTLIYLMGPSGSGKDSLINAARPYLAERGCDVMRRVITRSAESVGEDAVGVSPEAFESLKHQRAFALHWQAKRPLATMCADAWRWAVNSRASVTA